MLRKQDGKILDSEILGEPIRLTSIIQTCTACPSQWDACDEDGNEYYIRYRHGFLYVELYGKTIFTWEGHPNGMADGFMTTEQMLEITGFTDAT